MTSLVVYVEFEIAPHPIWTLELPPISSAVPVFFSATTQYSSSSTSLAVAVAVIVGTADMKIEEKPSFFWTDKVTRTAVVSPA